ncbi:hypothetical protein V8C35DRAFT_286720 [Trichoderma chlorosporum]
MLELAKGEGLSRKDDRPVTPGYPISAYLGRQPSVMEADHRGAEHRVPPWSLRRGRGLGRGHGSRRHDNGAPGTTGESPE